MNPTQIRDYLQAFEPKRDRTIVIVDFANVEKWQHSLQWNVGIQVLLFFVPLSLNRLYRIYVRQEIVMNTPNDPNYQRYPYGSNPNGPTVAGGFPTCPYSTQYPYQPPQNYLPYPPPPPPRQRKWYQSNGGIILLLFLFFPIGLYLIKCDWSATRRGLTCLFLYSATRQPLWIYRICLS